MTKLNICVDIDGTVTEPYYWLPKANEYFCTNVKEEQITQYDIDKVLNIPRHAYLKFYDLYGEEIHRDAKIREKAREVLTEFNKDYNVYYVTAREERLLDITKKWLRKNHLFYKGLYLLGTHYKVDQAKKLECDIFIEDRYANAVQLAIQGFQVLLIDNNYNRLPLIPGIIRVTDWDEVREIVYKQVFSESIA
jgi:uncharacterized HAD superfamily protein